MDSSVPEISKPEHEQKAILSSPKSPTLSPIRELNQKDWKPGTGEWFIFACLAVVSLVVALDATIVVPVLPAIARALSGDATDTFWTGTSYLLTCAVFQPFVVSLSDIFGRRQLLFLSVLLFTVGTVVCCVSENFTQLLAGRCVQGIGGGGTLSLGLVIMTDIVPLRQRPTYNGIIQIAWAIGTITGPLVGGLFADHSTWRWVFYINFPFCAVGLLMIPFVVRLQAKRVSLKERLLYHVDWIGSTFFIAGTSSFLIGISWGGSQYAWDSFRTLVPIILGVFGIIITLVWERYAAKTPFIRLWLFKSQPASAAYACAILQGLLMFCELYYLPIYLESAKALSATLTGVGLIPITGALLPTSVTVGALITRFGRYRWAIWTGWAAVIASTALLIILSASTPTYGWVLLFIPIGLGHGLVLMSLNFGIQALARERDGAYAAAMYTFLRTFGMCLGVAIGGTVFQNRLAAHLRNGRLDEGIARDAEAFITVLKDMDRNTFPVERYREAYAAALRNVFEVLTGIAALGGGMSIFISHASMDRALDSEHVMAG
ncbi:MFS general substrate transporter [Lojkania enalia]|uniref:MFS general substrate transporter n=1 Tax=Lojkania enalia TaxID=147567 RepID=A0A9P4KIT5_9PLEO|nr:MFS general substrate transporter [Didymosphaeria enalia]